MFSVLTKATKEFLQSPSLSSQKIPSTTGYVFRSIAPATPHTENVDTISQVGNRMTEAKMLAHVTKALDFVLELQC